MDALPDGDALTLAQMIREGEVSASELLEAAIRGVERINPQLNAVVGTLYDDARARVAQPLNTGPFAGVPFLIKDLLSDYAGAPTSSGSRFLKDYVPEQDSDMVVRYKRSGLNIFGKTNTPEFGLTPFTEPALFGPARNPWNPAHTPGGSSGGTGAAIAAGLVPMAGGGDGGGSIRIPASCNGLVGLKPTRGRTPAGPTRGDIWFGCAIELPLSRTVRDTAAALDALSGPEPGDPYQVPPPPEAYLAALDTPVRPLRIAVSGQPMLGDDMHPDCLAGLDKTVQQLEALGHTVNSDHPPLSRSAFVEAFIVLLVAEPAADVRDFSRKLGREPKRGELEPTTAALVRLAAAFTADDLALALRELQWQTRLYARWLQSYDVFLTPTLAEPPFKIGKYQPSGADKFGIQALNRLPLAGIAKRSGLIEKMAQDIFRFIPNTPVTNVTGDPAISLPLHWNDAGLPVGMMFAGQFGDETTLLQLARQLEQAMPWAERRPPVHAT